MSCVMSRENRLSDYAKTKAQISCAVTAQLMSAFLAHLSRRLEGELIVYPWSGIRPSSASVVCRHHPQFQT